MSKRLITFFISLICIFFIFEISRSIVTLWQRNNIVLRQEEALKKEQLENKELQDKLSDVESEAYIEKVAREKLNLQKEGEIVVVVPQSQDLEFNNEIVEEKLANWQKWWKLIF